MGDPEADEPTVLADTLIVATGARSLMLDVPNEDRLLGYGVSTCATCDGFFFRDQHIAVVGGGDSALEEALFLTRFASKVTVVHRRDELRASKIMQERAFANPKIEFLWNTVGHRHPRRHQGQRRRAPGHRDRRGVRARCDRPLRRHRPRAQHARCSRASSSWRTTATSRRSTAPTRTSVDGVFACGDVQDHYYRQAITSAGSGCMAAIDAERWLEDARRVAGNRTGRDSGVAPADKEMPMSEKIKTLTDATFDEHVKASDVPVLVDFWAEWCGPCKMISPVLEEIAEEQAGKIRIGKLNIDDNLDVTRRFDVMSIPTLILFKDGEPAGAPDRGQAQGPAARGDLGLPVGLPLAVGDRGDAVSDIQHRLTAILPGRARRRRRHLRPGHPGRSRGLPAPARPARRRRLRPPDLEHPGRGRFPAG